MPSSVSSVVFFSSHAQELVDLLRALGIALEHEVHQDEIEHWAGELDQIHLAVYPADDSERAPGHGVGGSTFFGVYVDDLDVAEDQAVRAGATIETAHHWRPWGCRVIVTASDGRSIEVNQRDHCTEPEPGGTAG